MTDLNAINTALEIIIQREKEKGTIKAKLEHFMIGKNQD